MDSASKAPAVAEKLDLDAVAAAWKVVRPALWPTALMRCPALEQISGYEVWLKPENLQRTGSYKIRGAYYKLHRLSQSGGAKKVIAASAGNHAQGIAWAAREHGLDCTIVMPERAPLPKRRATLSYGAHVLLEGSCFDESLQIAMRYAESEGRQFVSPFNDAEVITGQATLGWELLEEMRETPPDAVLIPVGGGGLIAGVASVVKQRLPQVRVIALQSVCAPAFVRSWEAYQKGTSEPLPLDIPTQETIADGVRVSRPGELCWKIARDLVDGAFCLDDTRVYGAILFLLEQAKLVAEGAGALAVAALLDPDTRSLLARAGVRPGSRVAAVITGGNIDSLTLQRVIERGLSGNGRSQAVGLRIRDEPGELGRILELLRRKRAVVLDIRRSWRTGPLISDMADMEILIETEDEGHRQEVMQELAKEAKAHHFELLLDTPSAAPGGP